MNRAEIFKPGSLRAAVGEVTAEALREGALRPISTKLELVDHPDASFQARVATSGSAEATPGVPPRKSGNPFLPYDPAVHVADVSDTHVCLLNKFNVIEHHVLIVTREFEEQTSLLTRHDFEALAKCLVEYDSLGFYNSGSESGASQPHKHLQLVPLPLASSGPRIPFEPLLRPAIAERRSSPGKATVTAPGIPFRHRVSTTDTTLRGNAKEAARAMMTCYRSMLSDLRLDSGTPRYNLLVTKDWMLMVPRVRQHFRSMSLNALAFAGAFFARDRDEFEQLKAAGPFEPLCHVTE